MLDNHSKHLGQVPGQVPHPPSYKSAENTLCQLWCQMLGDNTVAFPMVFRGFFQYSQIDSIGVSGDKKGLHWYQWYDWYQWKSTLFQ